MFQPNSDRSFKILKGKFFTDKAKVVETININTCKLYHLSMHYKSMTQTAAQQSGLTVLNSLLHICIISKHCLEINEKVFLIFIFLKHRLKR